MEEILETTCSSTEGGEEEGAVRDAFGPRGGQFNRIMSRDTGDDLASLGKGLGDDGISDCGGFLLVCGADPRKDDDLLDWTTVLLVDPHDVEKSIDSDELGSGNTRNSGIFDGYGKVVRLETPGKTTDSDLTQDAHLAGNFSL